MLTNSILENNELEKYSHKTSVFLHSGWNFSNISLNQFAIASSIHHVDKNHLLFLYDPLTRHQFLISTGAVRSIIIRPRTMKFTPHCKQYGHKLNMVINLDWTKLLIGILPLLMAPLQLLVPIFITAMASWSI